jgi:hypothetical protein
MDCEEVATSESCSLNPSVSTKTPSIARQLNGWPFVGWSGGCRDLRENRVIGSMRLQRRVASELSWCDVAPLYMRGAKPELSTDAGAP